MEVHDLTANLTFDPARHIETVLGRSTVGDYSVATWESGQASPYHCHPEATEIYYCVSGGGIMRTPTTEVEVRPGRFVVHPPGELHEFVNGDTRTVLFRVRYGADMSSRTLSWESNPDWQARPQDTAYFEAAGAMIG